MDDDAKYAEWIEWLEVIDREMSEMMSYRFMYQYVRDIIQANKALPQSHFLWMLGGMYGDSMVMAVRRLVDKDDRTLSLFRLLADIADNAGVMTRRRFLSLYGIEGEPRDGAAKGLANLAHETFDEYAGAGDAIDPAIVTEDLTALTSLAAVVTKYANKKVAHFDLKYIARKPDESNPASAEEVSAQGEPKVLTLTFEELHAALDDLYEMYSKYLLILKATSRGTKVPGFQYDWNEFFRQPWLAEGFTPPEPD